MFAPQLRVASWRRLPRLVAWTAGVAAFAVTAWGTSIPEAATGSVESGVPPFTVIGADGLGLSSLPIDLHVLPDGRILVASQHELTLGDGVRWETFRGLDEEPAIFSSVEVGDDGVIYTGRENRVARFELLAGGRWRLQPVVSLPATGTSGNPTLISATMQPESWYWHGGSGAIMAWRPGQQPHVVGQIGLGDGSFGGGFTIDTVFTLGSSVYVSDQASGRLFRLRMGQSAEELAHYNMSDAVTCAVPFDSGTMLVGTVSAGLRIFDGHASRPFGPPGLLQSEHRITDLCAVGHRFYAAAIDSFGLVLFDHAGRVVQTLDRSLDHRLARVRRLEYANDGVLWVLLDDAVARVAFPSPISYFEPLLSSSLAFAQPLRHAGRLWALADGRAVRGVYDDHGRLERFEDATPPGRYLFTLSDVDGELFACSDSTIFVRRNGAWKKVGEVPNARLGIARSSQHIVYYVARGEYGTLTPSGDTYTITRTAAPELGDSFGSEVDAAGVGWLELGVSRVGRVDPRDGHPLVRIFTPKEGLLDGWVEVYQIDGTARFHMTDEVLRYDAGQDRFVRDTALLADLPQLATAAGRPVTDRDGRIWYTANGMIHLVERDTQGKPHVVDGPEAGFAPSIYTPEDDGVMWLFEKRRLARYDPRLPRPPVVTPTVLITSVAFPGSGRQVFKPTGALPSIGFDDNSLQFNFVAPGNPFEAPVTFEVLLEGAGSHWVSTGNVGTASFNRLKEGNYVFRVRPVLGNRTRGPDTQIAFVIRPPWFRTRLAYLLYGVAGLGLFGTGTWLTSYLQRRENRRLELLVARRTSELNASNTQLREQVEETNRKSEALAVSEERYRTLNTELEQRVTTRTAELSASNEELTQRELLFRLIFEHAPVGIAWKRTDLGNAYHLNATFRRILDLPSDTVAESFVVGTLVHPEDAARHAEQHRQLEQRAVDSYTVEERYLLPDNRQVWGLFSVAVVRNPEGQIIQEIGILEDITARKRAEAELAATHRELLVASRQAGMAEVATGILHNVGNVLNSVNISATVVADHVRNTKAVNIAKIAALLDQHKDDLPLFLTQDPRGRTVPEYLRSLGELLVSEQTTVLKELESLHTNISHIKDVVAMQQSYAQVSGFLESVSLPDLIEDAIRINSGSLARHEVGITRDYAARPVITTDKHKVVQILINLIRNAKYACDEAGRTDKTVTIRTSAGPDGVAIAVSDNGVGIPAENLTRIFTYGFTTRKNGHGFGLHSSALAAKEIGGSLHVESAGAGQGATFVLHLPLACKLARS